MEVVFRPTLLYLNPFEHTATWSLRSEGLEEGTECPKSPQDGTVVPGRITSPRIVFVFKKSIYYFYLKFHSLNYAIK